MFSIFGRMDIIFLLISLCTALSEQDALDAIATAIGGGCVSPDLSKCAKQCFGTNCELNIYTDSGNVNHLLAYQPTLTMSKILVAWNFMILI